MQNLPFTLRNRNLFPALLSLITAAAIPALSAQEKPAKPAKAPELAAPDSVLGQIGDIKITAGEIRGVLAGMGVTDGSITNTDPAALSQLVRNLLVQKMVFREAQDQGWDQQPDVKARIERSRETVVAESYVQSKCAPPFTYPSEAEIQAAYDGNQAALLVPKSYRLAQIFIASPEDADAETEKAAAAKLEVVRKALAAKDADFGAIASAHSEEAQTAGRGGEIGWLLENQVQPEIREKLPELKLNVVSEPLRLADGWHLVKVLEIREPFTPTLDQVRTQLKQRLRQERTRANGEAYMANLLKENPVAINELELAKVMPPAPEPAPPAAK